MGVAMGKMEFYAWVDQAWRETQEQKRQADTWEGSRQDPAWQNMRARRDQHLGRR